jgi:hypothetical protein
MRFFLPIMTTWCLANPELHSANLHCLTGTGDGPHGQSSLGTRMGLGGIYIKIFYPCFKFRNIGPPSQLHNWMVPVGHSQDCICVEHCDWVESEGGCKHRQLCLHHSYPVRWLSEGPRSHNLPCNVWSLFHLLITIQCVENK